MWKAVVRTTLDLKYEWIELLSVSKLFALNMTGLRLAYGQEDGSHNHTSRASYI